MSKAKICLDADSIDLFDILKKNYIGNEGIDLIHDILEREGFMSEEFSLINLVRLYNNLATSNGFAVSTIYQNPESVMPDHKLTQNQVERGFNDLARIYIQEYLALVILFKANTEHEILRVKYSSGETFSSIIEALLTDIGNQFSFHIREENEEKKALDVQVSHTPEQIEDLIIATVKLMLRQSSSDLEIITFIKDAFPDSPTLNFLNYVFETQTPLSLIYGEPSINDSGEIYG